MNHKLMDYIRAESGVNYYDIIDYFKDINQCGVELKAKYLGNLVWYIASYENVDELPSVE